MNRDSRSNRDPKSEDLCDTAADSAASDMPEEGASLLAIVAEQLALDGEAGDAFFGWFREFPVAVSLIGASGEFGLLVQIRHQLSGDSLPREDAYPWDDQFASLMQDGSIKVEVDDGIAWLSVYGTPAHLACVSVLDLMELVVVGLVSAGIETFGNTCHYCRSAIVHYLTYEDGRVGQICNGCLAHRRGLREVEKQATVTGITGSLLLGSVTSLVGAAIWALCWMLNAWILDALLRGHDHIVVPNVVLIGQVLLIGGLTGGVVGFVISRIPKRGYAVAAFIGLWCGLAAAVLGEILFAAWLAETIRPGIVVRVIIVLWTRSGFDALVRGMTVVVSMACAYSLAKPRLTPLSL